MKIKLKKSYKLIESVLKKHNKPVVACSFGKNSMAVLHLLRQIDPNIQVLFNDTKVEYPDSYLFKEKLCEEWSLNIIETVPTKDFWWIVENYGFPLYSRKGHKSASKNCARYLKEYPLEKLLRKEKFDLYFTGLSRHESRLREFSARKYGDYFFSKRKKHWKCHPVLNWTKEEIWEYHYKENIPINPIYKMYSPKQFEIRTACWCCTIPIKYGKMQFLRINYPKLWKKLLIKGLGELIIKKKLGEYKNKNQLNQLIIRRPDFFDYLS